MKDGVLIINTSRGAVINTEHLLEALENKKVGAAGLDVYEYEKNLFFENHCKSGVDDKLFNALRKKPNVMISGHQAFLTKEALAEIAKTTIYNLDCYQKNQPTGNKL
jgi:D-lactate dehydrogenase